MSGMNLVFIAVPTAGTVTNGKLDDQFLRAVAQLHLKYPSYTFIAPMIQDYQLLKFLPNTKATWDDWGKHCRTLIERCDLVWIMMYPGWDTSVGVAGEIAHANLHNKRVSYIDTVNLQ
jgi:hypothetical protein